MILVLDNYDSFTYNLVQYLGELGQKIEVYRNDRIAPDDIKEIGAEGIIISPGPGSPEDAGISKEVIRVLSGEVPIFGVCLGHQCIAEVYGAEIIRSRFIMHGKVSRVRHSGEGLFEGIDDPFTATRYHSLTVKESTIKEPIYKTAWTGDGEVMGIAHREHPLWGVQFHPESILTSEGMKIIRNFVRYCRK
jgi:anthranilate synthase/aminodeoxychorismate synthase-like glutamine amidotransferase